MTSLDTINSIWDWSSFDWTNKVDAVWRTTMNRNYDDGYLEQYIKMVLSWVVMSRIVMAHLYTITYIANFYSILTWSNGKILLPWLVMSAFKNFVLETIVLIITALLYIEGNVSGFLFSTVVTSKIVTMALATHNWTTIHAFHQILYKSRNKNVKNKSRFSNSFGNFNIVMGMSMQRPNLGQDIRKQQRRLSLPCLDTTYIVSNTDYEGIHGMRETKSLTAASSLDSSQLGTSCSHTSDDSCLSCADKVFGFTEKDLKLIVLPYKQKLTDNVANFENVIDVQKLVDKISKNAISEIDHIGLSGLDKDDSKTSTCVCAPESDYDIDSSIEKMMNINSLDEKEYHEYSEDSDWPVQWTLENMLKGSKSSEPIYESEQEKQIRVFYEDKHCQWSSDDELDTDKFKIKDQSNSVIYDEKYCQWSSDELDTDKEIKIEDKSNSVIYDEKYCQWSSEESHTDKSIRSNSVIFYEKCNQWPSGDELNNGKNEESLLLQLECIHILESIIENIVSKSNLAPQMKNDIGVNTETKIVKNVRTQTSKRHGYKTTLTQTSSDLPMQYNPHHMQMLMDLCKKTDVLAETPEDQQRRELEALKVYNALTLWKYKEDKDKSYLDASKISTFDQPKIRTSKKFIHKLKAHLNPYHKIDEFNIKNELDKSNASNDVSGISLLKKSHKSVRLHRKSVQALKTDQKRETLPTEAVTSSDNLVDLKQIINHIDWNFSSSSLNDASNVYLSNSAYVKDEEPTDIIDEYDTVALLRSAFSFDTNENRRGFYLGPASSAFYSISEQISNVLHEIVKAARIKVVNYNLSDYPCTQEVDFGETYLQNWHKLGEDNNRSSCQDLKEEASTSYCQDVEIAENKREANFAHCQEIAEIENNDEPTISDYQELKETENSNESNISNFPIEKKTKNSRESNICDYQDPKLVNSNNEITTDSGNELSSPDDEQRKHFFDDDSDWSDMYFSTNKFEPYIEKCESLSCLSNDSNMSEFSADVFVKSPLN